MSDLLQKVEAASRRLDVYVGDRLVGLLERGPGGVGSVFAYLPTAREEDFVSLLMPVRLESYSSTRGLLPVFQQNLPEGYMRREMVERFGKVLATDDHILLAFTGGDSIGRVRTVPGGFSLDWGAPIHCDIERILHASSTGQVFNELLSRYQGHGVSGAYVKSLVRERATLHDDGWILKHSGSVLPSLSVNEFFTMSAAARAGLQVPEFKLSDDGEILAVKRFDIAEGFVPGGTGQASAGMHGFEDFCSLLALPSEMKYQGTMERVLNTIEKITVGAQRVEAKDAMLASQMFAYACHNTDGHVKNFGVVYDSVRDVHIAPAFDCVTTKAYANYRSDTPALAIGGKKVAAVDKNFTEFAQRRGGLSMRQLREMAQRQAQALEATAVDVATYAAEHPEHSQVCNAMLREWEDGVRMLDTFSKRDVQAIGEREAEPAHSRPQPGG